MLPSEYLELYLEKIIQQKNELNNDIDGTMLFNPYDNVEALMRLREVERMMKRNIDDAMKIIVSLKDRNL